MVTRETGRLLTPAEAADFLRQSRSTLYRKIASGEIEALQVGRGASAPLRIRAGELERYLRRHPAAEASRAAA